MRPGLRSVSVAPGTTSPETSVTVPATAPTPWAHADPQIALKNTLSKTICRRVGLAIGRIPHGRALLYRPWQGGNPETSPKVLIRRHIFPNRLPARGTPRLPRSHIPYEPNDQDVGSR